jgi:hypothetical protein
VIERAREAGREVGSLPGSTGSRSAAPQPPKPEFLIPTLDRITIWDILITSYVVLFSCEFMILFRDFTGHKQGYLAYVFGQVCCSRLFSASFLVSCRGYLGGVFGEACALVSVAWLVSLAS